MPTYAGIFAMLDDECNFPKGTDDTFLAKIMDVHKVRMLTYADVFRRMLTYADVC
jgi:myosin heavy subunit